MKKEDIIKEMENVYSIHSKEWRENIWFHLERGIFIYLDKPIRNEVVVEMINEGRVFFNGIGKHQGYNMVKYSLT